MVLDREQRRQKIKDVALVISLLIAVIGVALSWFSWQAREVREISYIISDPVEVFDSSAGLSSIQVLDTEGEVVQGDVHLVEVVIWNSGNRVIGLEEARDPVKVGVRGVSRVLEPPRILQAVREDLAGFRLERLEDWDAEGEIFGLFWDHFDPDFGLRVQVVYEVLPGQDGEVFVDGYVVGLSQLRDASFAISVMENPWGYSGLFTMIGILLATWGSVIAGFLLARWLASQGGWSYLPFLFVFFAVIMLVLTGVFAFLMFEHFSPPPHPLAFGQ